MNVGQLYNSLSNAVIKDNFVLIIGSVNVSLNFKLNFNLVANGAFGR
jgi:hypothetical protein